MKKRDRFWLNGLVGLLLVVCFFVGVFLYNIIQLNGSYILEEIAEIDVVKKQIEWAITPILKNKDKKLLEKYCEDFRGNSEFAIRIFDENKNLLSSSFSKNKTLKITGNDSRVTKTKHSLWELYKHSFKDNSLEMISELSVDGKKYYIEITLSNEFVINAIIKAEKSIFIVFVLCLTALILGTFLLSYKMRKSFNSFEDSVIKISKGELDTELNIPENSLLKELALSISVMTKRLKIQIERLKQLEQYKTEFIQNITHEIKTPITAINSAIELIDEGNNFKGLDKECLDIISFQIKSINKLVMDILSLSEIDLKKTEEFKNFSPLNLSNVIKEAIEYQGITDCKIEFRENEEYIINANHKLLITAVSNLLGNAIKYSKSPKINVNILKKDDGLILEIKDYGIGISKEHLPRIFDRFYCIDKSRLKQNGGTGLGLSIVKNIVELHNWNITVESETNKGTSFKIFIS